MSFELRAMSLFARMPESAGVSAGFVKILRFLQFGLVDPLDNHLGNPVSPVKGVRLRTKIDYRDHDLTTVVGIDGAGGVDEPDSMFYRQTAAGTDLGFISLRKRHGKSGGQHGYFTLFQQHRFSGSGTDVHACGLRGHIAGQGNI